MSINFLVEPESQGDVKKRDYIYCDGPEGVTFPKNLSSSR